MALYVRVSGTSPNIVRSIRETVQALDPQLPTFEVHTLAQEMDAVLIRERLMAALSGAFGVLAVVLASVGLYGLFAFAVVQRTREIGIRMAVGAQPGTVVWTVMREVLGLVVLGIAIGFPVALALARLVFHRVPGLLYGVAPTDAPTVTAAALAMLIVTGLAGYLPARRASQVDPINALRS
jgi:ABC-type antimicrobial peptide transport system permease subunit